MVAMWFGTREVQHRAENQLAVLAALASLGIASGLVSLCNLLFVRNDLWAGLPIHDLFNRPRPFDPSSGLVVNLLFYRPSDPSFPSNLAAVLFGLALGIWVKNKKVGTWLLAMALLASFARIYVGVHYPTDILGGFLFGVAGTLLAYGFFKLLAPLLRLLLRVLKMLYLAG
jgi:undecaprenyl-diphosphatase